MPKFIQDYAHRRWEHFTSWWVYPVTLVLGIPLLVLYPLGVGGDATYIAFRLFVFAVLWLYIYDLRWRRKPRPEKGRGRSRV